MATSPEGLRIAASIYLDELERVMTHLELAKLLWDAYSLQAGGKTFDGKPLPTWEELGEDRQSCWLAVADAARAALGEKG